jgi:hypothetical protein
MPDISFSLDPTSDLVISLAEESIPNYCHIFCLPQTFPLLKINASRKSTLCISVKPLNRAMRSGACLLAFKGLSPKDIHTELESVSIDEALCLRRVYKWREYFMEERTELFDDLRSGRPLQNDHADALRAMIQEFPFVSCRRLCMHFGLVKSTCLCILHDVLRLKKFDLRWVASLSTTLERSNGCHFPRLLRKFLKKIKKGFAQVITGDESSFCFNYHHQSI